MDYSREYLEMCKAAKELQEDLKTCKFKEDLAYLDEDATRFYLLKQDDYMLLHKGNSDYLTINKLITWCSNEFTKHPDMRYFSIEKLWLCYTMWFSHRKVWSFHTECWVKQEAF